ncbi:MAG: penicillin-binding protein 1A [Gammaproteobacteria bacterium]
MQMLTRILVLLVSLCLLGAATGALGTTVAYFYFSPDQPEVDVLKDVQLQVPLRIFSRDGRLMAQFGDKRRLPVTWEELPPKLVQAYVSAEDDRFFEHPGVDYQGLLRAAYKLVKAGEIRGGGSTITMQLARAFFLTPDQSYKRKIREIFLAIKMEREFSKEEILTLYLNKIFLGQRAYGVGAAAEVYYGRRLHELSLAQMATLAGLPQAPSRDNPVRSPERAHERRLYVLRRMLETGAITQSEHDMAAVEPIETFVHGTSIEVSAPFVAEMVRLEVEKRYGREAINQGISVVTTLDSRLQRSAQESVRQGIFEYDRRHGYRGPLAEFNLDDFANREELVEKVAAYPTRIGQVPAVVLAVEDDSATLLNGNDQDIVLGLEQVAWAKRFIDQSTVGDEITKVSDVLDSGDVVYIDMTESDPTLSQMPVVQGALVAMDPDDGAVVSLVGGLDFDQSKFNRVVQARRQPGSLFKPFIYSAALELGMTPATVINDNAVVFQDAALEDVWRPKNYAGRFYGPTRLREALIKSRNLVSIRLLDRVGIVPTINHLRKFGFQSDMLPRDLSLALGSAAVTPLELVDAYSVFANGGFDVDSYFIDRIYAMDGALIDRTAPKYACPNCLEPSEESGVAPSASVSAVASVAGIASEEITQDDVDCTRVAYFTDDNVAPQSVSPQNVYLMTSIMRDVIRRGTGVRANRLGRDDLAGKTGTTNDLRDAWFSGFNSSLAAVSWLGFDKERPLGRGEAGASAALPMWTYFIKEALADVPSSILPEPEGMVTVLISPDSGLLASASRTDAVFETFRIGEVPDAEPEFERPLIDPFAEPAINAETGEPVAQEPVEEEELF